MDRQATARRRQQMVSLGRVVTSTKSWYEDELNYVP
jgi:hypothetical protein